MRRALQGATAAWQWLRDTIFVLDKFHADYHTNWLALRHTNPAMLQCLSAIRTTVAETLNRDWSRRKNLVHHMGYPFALTYLILVADMRNEYLLAKRQAAANAPPPKKPRPAPAPAPAATPASQVVHKCLPRKCFQPTIHRGACPPHERADILLCEPVPDDERGQDHGFKGMQVRARAPDGSSEALRQRAADEPILTNLTGNNWSMIDTEKGIPRKIWGHSMKTMRGESGESFIQPMYQVEWEPKWLNASITEIQGVPREWQDSDETREALEGTRAWELYLLEIKKKHPDGSHPDTFRVPSDASRSADASGPVDEESAAQYAPIRPGSGGRRSATALIRTRNRQVKARGTRRSAG